MKKITTEEKEYLVRQAYRKNKHEKKRREHRKKLRIQEQVINVKDRRGRKFVENPNKVKHQVCKAPTMFSLADDPVSVIGYFEDAKKSLAKDMPVIFDLSEIKQMGPETLTYLCAFVKEDKFTHGTALKGNTPNDEKLKEMFRKAGFYNFVVSANRNDYYRDISSELIHKITRKKVENKLAGEVCVAAMLHTFDSPNVKKQSIYRILIECMANTWNHSSYRKLEKEYNWWLIAYKETDTRITKFCFLDLGIGVFDSIDKKYREGTLDKLKEYVIPSNNIRTLEKIFQGKKRTSTKKDERGLGMKYIYNLVKNDPYIKNFTFLSNDVHAKIGYNTDDSIIRINNRFIGTMYYWELIPSYE